MSRPERPEVLELLRQIAKTPLGEHLILCGSSGLYAASATIPALTEDVDVLVDADWIAVHERAVLEQMLRLGFNHEPGTPTFVSPDGLSVDMVGYSHRDVTDRIGGGKTLAVMVFADLSKLLSSLGSTVPLPDGGRALSPAALVASKLLTIRLEKGSKDKLQALLVVAENASDSDFLAQLRRLLGTFPVDRVEDAIADAQAASLSISGDVVLAGAQAVGYAPMQRGLERGLMVLLQLLGFHQAEP